MKKNRVTKALGWKQEVMTQLQLSKLRKEQDGGAVAEWSKVLLVRGNQKTLAWEI